MKSKQMPGATDVKFPASIQVGGPLPQKFVKGLAGAIARSCSKRFGRDRISKQSITERLLRASAASVTSFELAHDRALFGRFPDIEEFCIAHQVAFRRRSSAYLEYDAEVLVYMPLSRKHPHNTQCSQNGEPVARLSELELALKRGQTLKQILKRLRAATEQIPPLIIV